MLGLLGLFRFVDQQLQAGAPVPFLGLGLASPLPWRAAEARREDAGQVF
jgi:hypothetical protein